MLWHVNNAVMSEYLEACRWVWLAYNRFPRTCRIVPVVARIEIDYRLEILPPEIKVSTVVEDPVQLLRDRDERFQCIFLQTVFRGDEGKPVIAADARVQVAFIDFTDRRIRSLQDYLTQPTNQLNYT
jgi:acyl-CoA thioester hydrolase